jgi:RNA polymerase sigma factor (sigma-70 family)
MGSGPPGSAGEYVQRLFAEGSLTGLTDSQLLERYVSRRDELAFGALVERHAALVWAVCRRALDDPGNVDDAFQATFLVLARRAGVMRDQKALANWLFGVARRVCSVANRAAARRRRRERRAAEVRGLRETTVVVDHGEHEGLIYEEIERLPSAYRLPVVLCLMQGRSRAEAADALRWTEGMVRGRLARARRLLRSRLIRRGVTPATALAALACEATAADAAVRRGLIARATHAATRPLAAGSAAAALTEGVIRIMLFKKLTISAAMLVAAVLVAWTAAAALVAREEPAPAATAVQAAPKLTLPPGFVALDDPTKTVLHGRVISSDGKPVAGARVWGHSRSGASIAEVRTDANGRFRLEPIALGNENRVVLCIDADGYALWKSPRSGVLAFAGLDCDLGNIQVDPGRVFRGQVLDADGKPRLDTTIEASVHRNYFGHSVEPIGPGQPRAGQTLTTDAEGRFRTPPLPVGHLNLTVRAPEQRLEFVGRKIAPGGEEDLGLIRLEKEVRVTGFVKDEEGKPIAGVHISALARTTITFADGDFALAGFGSNASFLIHASKPGYEPFAARVTVTPAGIVTANSALPPGAEKPSEPVDALVVTLRKRQQTWFEGRAVDADTGVTVRLDRVVVFHFDRGPNGEIVPHETLNHFEQPERGWFRAFFDGTGEFRLTFSATGYEDAEIDVPRVTERKTIGGILVLLRAKIEGVAPALAGRTISGTVTRAGRPVPFGWVVLRSLTKPMDAVNAPVMRGRTVVGPPRQFAVPIRDGSYTLDVPFESESWYVVVEEPGHALTQVGPIAIAPIERKMLDIACREGGRIRGRVKGVPPGWEGNVWVVAFSKTAVREEARVARDGTFALPPLPPGEYGLKVGHDAYDDAEVFPGSLLNVHPEAFEQTADPWKRATVVTVKAGQETAGVEVEFPGS